MSGARIPGSPQLVRTIQFEMGTQISQNGVVTDAVGSDPQYDVFADEFLDPTGNNLYSAGSGQASYGGGP